MGVRCDAGLVLYFFRLICLSAIILRGIPHVVRGIPHALLPMHCDGLKTSSLYSSLVVPVFCSIKRRLDVPAIGKLSLLFNRTTSWLPLAFPFHITQTTGAVETELYLSPSALPSRLRKHLYTLLWQLPETSSPNKESVSMMVTLHASQVYHHIVPKPIAAYLRPRVPQDPGPVLMMKRITGQICSWT